jgi:hypothetical protein
MCRLGGVDNWKVAQYRAQLVHDEWLHFDDIPAGPGGTSASIPIDRLNASNDD